MLLEQNGKPQVVALYGRTSKDERVESGPIGGECAVARPRGQEGVRRWETAGVSALRAYARHSAPNAAPNPCGQLRTEADDCGRAPSTSREKG